MANFSIIALKVLDEEHSNITKVLKKGWYFFNQSYKPDEKGDNKLIINDEYPLKDNDFFGKNISIGAIVGKNGDGKSSIVELVMRVLNNFAYASGYSHYQEDLRFVEGVYAIVYYSIGNIIYTIESRGHIIVFKQSDKEPISFDIDNLNKRNNALQSIKKYLFYTQISNYSLYAYNAKEFAHESPQTDYCWINGIFHKNDGYQTPIVLNPWRWDGNIDINKENSLTKDRLVSLFVSDKGFRNINTKQQAEFLTYSQSDSKLERKSISDFFKATQEKDKEKIRNEGREFRKKFEHKFGIELTYQYDDAGSVYGGMESYAPSCKDPSKLTFAAKILLKFYQIESNLIETAVKVKQKIMNDIFNEPWDGNFMQGEPDIQLMFNLIRELSIKNANNIDTYTKLLDLKIKLLNSKQFMRIVLIACYRDEWIKFIKDNYKELTTIPDETIDYLAYKSISIVYDKNYPQYKDFQKNYDFIQFISDKQELSKIHTECGVVIKFIVEQDKSHVTLKIRQTLNYIQFNEGFKYINIEKDNDSKLAKSYSTNIGNTKETPFIVSLENYKNRLNNIEAFKSGKISAIELLPPPIFNTDVIIKQTEDNTWSLLSRLSSGERQELNSISSVIYHLKNINSVIENDEMIKYRYVNLIFEEIELYFHPEYQRRYIKRMIEQIGKAELNCIEGINMCFVTHSPFILSDIPKCNICFLDKGKQIPNKNMPETFSANIHDILRHNFFLENGFVGEFAKSKIEEVIKIINLTIEQNDKVKPNNEKKCISNEDYKKCKKIISLIGEPLIRRKLLMMIEDVYENKLELIEDKQALLKDEMEDLEKQKQKLTNK
ncbi:hypothetical protein AGMMS49965_16200 [Bacteroidia bacterium]|nr:hypothetical protein AGMMS49965_16200 [Bacteroidia bacterium]